LLQRDTGHPNTSGIILAGGTSSRLGRSKAFLEIEGQFLVERVSCRLRQVVDEIVLVTNSPNAYRFLGLTTIKDVFEGVGALGGIHAGLSAISRPYGLVVGCDMPFLNVRLLRYMITLAKGYDAVIPRLGSYMEPLHAVYARQCVGAIEEAIRAGQRRVLAPFSRARIRHVTKAEIAAYDPNGLSFFNVNTPQDVHHMIALAARGER